MRGSNSATKDPDQLVWVVEAQGSWRDAGIVPEEKRQDFSVGLVAFDADTGRRYGASHVNTSLLGTHGSASPSSRPPTPTATPSQTFNRPGGPTPTPGPNEQRIQLPQAVEQAVGDQPSPDWTLAAAPGLADQPGFSLRLPTGWELRETRPLDSYVGELVGDGVTLRFDYGRFSPSLDPAGDPENTYVLRYEFIGGYEAKLVIPLDRSGGLTGVHFRAMDGLRLTLWGRDLTPEQQRTACAIFRSIRSSSQIADGSPKKSGTSKPTPRLIIRRGSMSASHERIRYEAVAGPIRAELLDTKSLSSNRRAHAEAKSSFPMIRLISSRLAG